MSHYFDVITIGSEMAGLVAGSLLARRGFRVLVVRDAEDPDNYVEAGYTLPHLPLPVIGEGGAAWKRVLAELNLAQSVRRRLVVQRPPYQVVLPNARIDGGTERHAVELARELPAAQGAIEQFLARAEALGHTLEPLLAQDVTLPPDGFWERRELGRIKPQLPAPEEDPLAPLGADDPARALASAPAALTGHLFPPSSVSLLRLHDLWRRGAMRLPGGRSALRALLEERITTHSGEVGHHVVNSINLRRGRVAGITTLPRGELIGCGFLLLAMPTANALTLLGDAAPRRLVQSQQALPAAAWRYVLNIVLALEGLPEGMGENVFVVAAPDRPLDEDNALAVHQTEIADGRAYLQVVALARSAEPSYVNELGQRVRARLEDQLLPFLSRHVLCMHSPHEGESPRPMTPVYAAADPGALGVGATPLATGVKNMLIVGAQSLPGLGFEGELTAAWGAARLITTSEKKRNPLEREVLLP
jgi:phytoene dehydrogenase-like protein